MLQNYSNALKRVRVSKGPIRRYPRLVVRDLQGILRVGKMQREKKKAKVYK